MPDNLLIRLGIDTRELQEDIERVRSGELELPTVSAFKVSGKDLTGRNLFVDDVPVYLDEG